MARKEGDSRKLYELLRRGFRSKEACAVAKQVTEFPDATAEDWFSRGICAYFARDAQDMRFAFDKAVTMDTSIAGPPFVRAIAAETHLEEKHRDLGNGIRVRIPRFFAAAIARDVNVPGEVLGAWYPSSSSVAVVFYVRNEGQSEKTLESWKNEALQRLSSIGGHLLRESEQSVAGKPAFDFILEANGTGRSLSGTASANPNTIQRWVGVKNSNDMIFFLTSALRNDFDQRNAEFEVVLSTLDFAGEKRPSADSMMDGLRQKCRASAEGVAEALAQSRSIPLDEPMSPFHQLVLGELRILDEKPQDAALLISKAIATGGREVYFQKSLGWALWRANRRTEAGAAFEKAIGKTKLEGADLDQWIAAYFLDRATEKEFVDRASGERNVTAAFAWFYIGQRKESDGSVADAIAAYQKSLAAADEHKIHSAVSNFAAYRLAQLETHAQGKSSSR